MASPRHLLIIVSCLAILFGAVYVSGVVERMHASKRLRTETEQMAPPSISVVLPKRAALTDELVLPGNVQPYITSPIFSRTNGYLKAWYVDIGGHVKRGQLLAEIETPEVDQQLEQSRGNLATAEANLALAEITMHRYQDLLKSDSVSQQDVDNTIGTYKANQAIVEANRANVRQLEALQSFEEIYAPFDGIITARNTDIGDLINSGSNGDVKSDLFHEAQTSVLRVYVNVPEEYSQASRPGLTAELELSEFPGKLFPGKLVRTSESINFSTRTLLTEVDVNNTTGELLTGSYAEVHFKVPSPIATFVIPVDALMFRSEGLRVAVVRDGKADLVAITPGHDYGNSIEIVSGLKGDERVILSPPDSLVEGEPVQVEAPYETQNAP